MFNIVEENISIKALKKEIHTALISDIHLDGKRSIRELEKAIKKINERKVDIIFIAGDFISYGKRYIERLELLSNLKSKYGVYGVLGNHDYMSKLWKIDKKMNNLLTKGLKKNNVIILDNESTLLKIGKNKINLVGLDSYKWSLHNVEKAFSKVNKKYPTIGLSHNPEIVMDLGEYKADLLLCGHTHGFTIRLPLIGPIWQPKNKLGRKYDMGLKVYKGQKLYISAGLGQTKFEPRIFNRSEINFLTFNPS